MVSFKSLAHFNVSAVAAFVALAACWTPTHAAVLPVDAREISSLQARQNSMATKLGPQLSIGSTIYFIGDSMFDTLTERWSLYSPPKFVAVVDARTESDVVNTVKIANAFGLPWLAISGHHGGISTLSKMKYGIQISMGNLNKVTIAADGKTATIGGGSLSKHITDTLWAKGKQTVTGACECTSLLGPMLGGGHGWLQGRYGLAIDNLVEARVVLACGSIVTVSATSNSDLFWGLRGAGHNFGIVTQVKYKIYDVPKGDRWTYAGLIFKQDKVEKLFDLANKFTAGGNQPVEFIQFIWYLRIPTIDPVKPVMILHFTYQGSQSQAAKYLDQYKALGPANTTIVDAKYTDISSLTGNGNDGIACAHGEYSAQRFPTGIEKFNLTTQRRLMDKFHDLTIQTPALNNSFYLFESYSVKGVHSVDASTTAFPDRFNNHLTSPVFVYFDSANDQDAVKAGTTLRNIMLDGKPGPVNAYVNYAHGDESLEDWYGHEAWRIQRLKQLKAKYDPQNRLGYYAPIPTK